MSKGMGRAFGIIEGEDILRVRIKNQAKTEQNKKFKPKKKKKRGEGTNNIWYLKDKINEDLEIKLRKIAR